MNKLTSRYYEKYVGCFAKRFYTPFKKENIFKITGFKLKKNIAYFEITSTKDKWDWDIEDCVIITNEKPIITEERVANINHIYYRGYNPFTEE